MIDAGGPGAGGLGGDVGALGGAVVDGRAHGDGDAIEVVERVAHLAAGRPGDAGDDVAVGGEVGGVDGDRAVAGEREGGVDELVEVDGRRVVDDDRARRAHR